MLEHVYTGRPPTAQALTASFTTRPSPRPSILQLSDLAPPVTAYSISHSNLLLVAVSSRDAQSLAFIDFLHRLVDIFEDFLGSPLIAIKIEDNFEIVAQLLGEMCDGGIVCNTEPNALRENVEVSSALGKLFTHVGLPGYVRPSEGIAHADCIGPLRLLVLQAISLLVYVPVLHKPVDQRSPGAELMFAILRTSSMSI